MSSSKFRWVDPKPIPENVREALDSYSVPFQSILFQRDITTAQEALDFLLPPEPDWYPEVNLNNIDSACQMISQAISRNHSIGIFGDYDADGITATALLTLSLRELHDQVTARIPSRMMDGYGITKSAIDDFHNQGVSLIITVDNGIRAREEVEYAKSLGMSIIVTDHHSPGAEIPAADAVINPKLPGDSYPNKALAGVGVAYKLVSHLADHYYHGLHPSEYLDLVAVGTIADIVPLTNENRYLVRRGLRLINQRPRQSLHSIIGASGLTYQQITASDISFQIAPRLNSSGRLNSEDYLTPLKLLLSSDPAVCGKLAQILETHNQQRKRISRDLQEFVSQLLTELDPLPPVLIALDNQVDLGVAGIAAGYLSRKFHRPAVVGKKGPSTTTASCRSIPSFNIIEAFDSMKDLFIQYGGHKMAAGFTIPNQNLSEFKQELIKHADHVLAGVDLQPELPIDARVSLADLDENLFSEISKLEPTGESNPRPVFSARNLSAKSVSRVGKNRTHLRLTIRDRTGSIQAIGFGLGKIAENMPERFDAAFHFDENHYRGRKNFQLQILDIKPF